MSHTKKLNLKKSRETSENRASAADQKLIIYIIINLYLTAYNNNNTLYMVNVNS